MIRSMSGDSQCGPEQEHSPDPARLRQPNQLSPRLRHSPDPQPGSRCVGGRRPGISDREHHLSDCGQRWQLERPIVYRRHKRSLLLRRIPGDAQIPAIGLSVRVYEGTDSGTLAKGAGHFPGTSIWDGNVCVAGHNRGVRDDFGDLHTLKPGDTVTWTTKLGTRTYEVVSVEKVLETDTSGTTSTSDNRLTLYTCVKNQRAYRWCVTAVAK